MTAVVITTHRWSQPRDSPHGSADQSCCPELTPASVRSSNSTPEITCMSKFGRSSIFINSQKNISCCMACRYTTVTFLFFFVSKPKLPNDLMSVFQLSGRPCRPRSTQALSRHKDALCEIFKKTLNEMSLLYCMIGCVLYDVH